MADYGLDVKDFLYGAAIMRTIESQRGLDFSIRISGQFENLLRVQRIDSNGNRRDLGLLLKHARELARQKGKAPFSQHFDFNLNSNEQSGLLSLGIAPTEIVVGFICADKASLGAGISEYGRSGSRFRKDRYFFAFTTMDKLSSVVINNKQGDCKLLVVRTAINSAHIYKKVRGGQPQIVPLTVADFARAIF